MLHVEAHSECLRFQKARTFEKMDPLCEKIYAVASWTCNCQTQVVGAAPDACVKAMLFLWVAEVEALQLLKGQAKGLINELKKRG